MSKPELRTAIGDVYNGPFCAAPAGLVHFSALLGASIVLHQPPAAPRRTEAV